MNPQKRRKSKRSGLPAPRSEAVVTFISHKELTGKTKELDQIIAEMQAFDPIQLVEFGCKINLVLDRDGGLLRPDVHYALIKPLPLHLQQRFAGYQRIYQANCKVRGVIPGFRPIVSPMHALYFIKRVLLHHELKGTRRIQDLVDSTSPGDVLLLLIACGDHLAAEVHDTIGESDGLKETYKNLIRNWLFLENEPIGRIIGRYHRIWFHIRETVSPSEQAGIDLDGIFLEATGVRIENFFAIGFALMGHFSRASLLKAPPSENGKTVNSFLVTWDSFFATVTMEPEELGRMKSLLALSCDEAREEFRRQHFEGDTAFEYYLLPFMLKPLIALNDDMYMVPHYLFLIEKITTGIYWLIFDQLAHKPKLQGAFKDLWGCLCQKAIEEIFREDICQFRDDVIAIYDPPYVRAGSLARGTDVILYNRRTKELWLFDVTYSALRVETLFHLDNLTALSDGINKLIDKARQLDTVIEDIRSGTLRLDGVEPSTISRFYPCIITMRGYPLMPFVWNTVKDIWIGINQRLKSRNFLQRRNTARLLIFNAGEMERLGALQRGGEDVLAVLKRWLADAAYSEQPLSNFLHYRMREAPTDFSRLKAIAGSAFDFVGKIIFPEEYSKRHSK